MAGEYDNPLHKLLHDRAKIIISNSTMFTISLYLANIDKIK